MNIDNFKLQKKLGAGMVGTTYLAEYKNKKYALKIEKISEKNLKKNLSTRDWRDIEFSETFANKYPDQFIYLYTYDIINNCSHIQEYPDNKIPSYLPKYVIKLLKEKQQSNYCIRKVYSLIDNNFSSISKSLTKEQYYSFMGQISYIYLLLQKYGYTHNDLHGENIGVSYVNKNKKIDILKYKFPTLGIQYKALDFGMVMHDKYQMNKEEKIMHKFHKTDEINRVIRKLVSFENSKLITSDKNINVFNQIKKHFLFKTTGQFLNDIDDRFILFQILYPEEFQKIYYKDNFEKTKYPILKIDLIDFIYILKNKNNPKKIIKLCYNKLKNIN
jgi:serine/threonine protein kinase